MFERFTERARQVVVLAQQEAREHKHGYIGTEHVLMGLLLEEEGLAARVLASLDITVEETRAEIMRIVGTGSEDKPVVEGPLRGQIPFTPRAKKILELALREALSLGHNYIGTEHILLGMEREDEGVAARILRAKGADSETVRNEVIRMLSGPGGRRRREESAGDAPAASAGRVHRVEGPGPQAWTISKDKPPTDMELILLAADVMTRAGLLFEALNRRMKAMSDAVGEMEEDDGEQRAAG